MKNEVINIISIPANARRDDINDATVILSLITEKITKFTRRSSPTNLHITYLHTDIPCVKSVRIRSYSGPYFPALGLNTERYSIFLRICPNAKKCGSE